MLPIYFSITTGVAAVGGILLTLFPPTAPIGAATLVSSSIVGAPGAAYGTGNHFLLMKCISNSS